jgi:acyl-CoA thioesterase-1
MKAAPQFTTSVGYGAMRAIRNLTFACALATPALADPLTLVALGDSLTAGYGLPPEDGFVPQLQAWLTAQGQDVVVVNAGVSGDTTAGGVARLDWSLTPEVDAMIVTLGGNDLLRGLDPASTYANLNDILTRLAGRNIPVLLAGMLGPRNLGQEFVTAFEGAYQRLAREHDVVFYPFFLEGVAGEAALNQPDGIHPNGRGVAVMVERIMPSVEALLARARA